MLQVEEERLNHVLGDLAGDQLGEVAALDAAGGVEIHLRALDRASRMARGAGIGALSCFFNRAGNDGRIAASAGDDGVPPGIL